MKATAKRALGAAALAATFAFAKPSSGGPKLSSCFIFQRNASSAPDSACLEGALVAAELACLKSLALGPQQVDALNGGFGALRSSAGALEAAYGLADATYNKGLGSLASKRWNDAILDFNRAQIEAQSAAAKAVSCYRAHASLLDLLTGPLRQESYYQSVRPECRTLEATYTSLSSVRDAAEYLKAGCVSYENRARNLEKSAPNDAALAERSAYNEERDRDEERRRREEDEEHRRE